MAGSVTTTTSVGVPVTGEEEEAAMAAVRDMLGPDQQLLSVEKTVVVREEEVVMIIRFFCYSRLIAGTSCQWYSYYPRG